MDNENPVGIPGTPAYIMPTPEQELTERDQLEIDYLAKADDAEFDHRVNEWLHQADEDGSGRRVFYSMPLAARTYDTLDRLLNSAQRRRDDLSRQPSRNQRAMDRLYDLDTQIDLLRRAHARAKLVRSVIVAPRGPSTNQRALKLLGRLHPDDLRRIRTALKRGTDEEELLAALKAEKEKGHP